MKRSLFWIFLLAFTVLTADPLFINEYGSSESSEQALDFIITQDSSYVIAGICDEDIYILKISADGDSLWYWTFGDSSSEMVYSIAETADSGFIVAFGRDNENGLRCMGISSHGDSLWSRFYPTLTGICRIVACADGHYACTAMIGDKQLIIFKIDEQGNTIWMKGTDSNSSESVFGFDIVADPDSGVTVVHLTTSIALMKLSADGDSLWSKEYTHNSAIPGAPPAIPFDLRRTRDGGYLISGNKIMFSAQMQLLSLGWIIRTDAQGDTLWTRSVLLNEQGAFIQGLITKDDCFAGAGSDGMFIKLSKDWESLWQRELFIYALRELPDGRFAMLLNNESDNIIFAVADSLGQIPETYVSDLPHDVPEEFELFQNTPNPFNAGTILHFSLSKPALLICRLFDISGREVDNFRIDANTNRVEYAYNASHLSSGIYILAVRSGNTLQQIKMVNLK